MIRTLLADAVLIAHLRFILFAILGGLLVLRWPRLIWLHLAALAWALAVEVAGLTCPLTPLEWRLRGWDDSGETSGFIARYLTPLIYPPGLTQAPPMASGSGADAGERGDLCGCMASQTTGQPGHGAEGCTPERNCQAGGSIRKT